ncbi:MAG: hypothetical protein DMD84_23175 [Candidatus Rokuibacteriota bacterium]|nr:MAG: hypothetical protein DMD84_23175 [Candidatus Rokubacteria bacterium]
MLNDVLTAELTAVKQYFIHARMSETWGGERLWKKVREESIGEMRHAYRPNPEKDLVKIAGSDAARGGRDARVSKTTRHARRGHVSQDGLSAKACMFVRP